MKSESKKASEGKKAYVQPKLTVHGDLRVITAMKASNMREAGMPRTFNMDNP
jgi:hypothetical protein